ncbi:MAG TPA: M20 aminoacylase family protein [Acetobacteraceae bacterium]|nr:M20 aminoacylase family protein [Acetobacteraceae bacterium]
MPVLNRIADLAPEIALWRQDFHAHPELGFEERRTSALVAEKLASWGIEVTAGIAGTGLVGTLRNGSSARSIGLRADMDALPMEEANNFAHRSTVPGVMHGCGHDGHTAMLLGAAKYLAETRNFDGTVHFIFQPAEEGGGGGKVMVDEGLFERFPCDAVYGVHNDPGLSLGKMVVMEGAVNAFSDRFWIRIRGIGGHAARPHRAIDPVVLGAQIVLALQTIVARRIDPIDSAVISITQFHAGSAGNVIPPDAVLNGTVRTLKPSVRDEIAQQMDTIVRSTAIAHGAEASLEYNHGYPQVVNAPAPTRSAVRAAAKIVGEDKIIHHAPPRMGGEDFSYMANAVPGCFVRIGQAGKAMGKTPVHHPEYDFNDEMLPIGASFWATLVEQELGRGER